MSIFLPAQVTKTRKRRFILTILATAALAVLFFYPMAAEAANRTQSEDSPIKYSSEVTDAFDYEAYAVGPIFEQQAEDWERFATYLETLPAPTIVCFESKYTNIHIDDSFYYGTSTPDYPTLTNPNSCESLKFGQFSSTADYLDFYYETIETPSYTNQEVINEDGTTSTVVKYSSDIMGFGPYMKYSYASHLIENTEYAKTIY